MAKRMLACMSPVLLRLTVGICEGHALVLYVFITDDDVTEGPVLTYYIPAHD